MGILSSSNNVWSSSYSQRVVIQFNFMDEIRTLLLEMGLRK